VTRPTSRTSRSDAAGADVPVQRAMDDDPGDALSIVAAEEEIPSVVPHQLAGGVGTQRRFAAAPFAMRVLKQYSLVFLLIASFVLYSTWGKTSSVFLTGDSLRVMVGGQAVIGVLTLGILVTMVAGNFDLSVGNIAGLCQVMVASMYSHHGWNMWVGILFGVALGAFVGGINGFLVTLLRVDPFIITLGTASAILGFVDWYSKGQSIVNGQPQGLVDFGRNNWLGVPDIVWVLIIVAFVIYYLLEHTPYGRNLHAIGSNRAAARLVGIRVERSIGMAFVINGFFAGVAGVLMLARAGAGNPQIPPTLALTALAGAFLGAASFKVGRLNVPGTIVALLFLAVNITGLTLAGVANWINELFTGLSLIFAIAMAAVLAKEPKVKRAAERPQQDVQPTGDLQP
jgi:ribose transport system permease protein